MRATLLLPLANSLLRPEESRPVSIARLVLLIALFGMTYGALMGTFCGPDQPPRLIQATYSAIKLPILLLLTFLLALPSFYVINMLLGLGDDFPQALRAILSTQAGLTVILASLAPFTVLFYASTINYDAAILFNAAMLGFASVTAQRLLRRFYAPLIARDARHRKLIRIWLLVYAFVGIQMGWVLRPFVGHPDSPTTFFRDGAWGNAYIEVWKKTLEVAGAEPTRTRRTDIDER